MGGLFSGGGTKAPAPKVMKEVVEAEKPTQSQQDDSAALRARRRRISSLLSPERENAMQGLPRKLSGGQ